VLRATPNEKQTKKHTKRTKTKMTKTNNTKQTPAAKKETSSLAVSRAQLKERNAAKKKFICEKCGAEFANVEPFNEHVEQHLTIERARKAVVNVNDVTKEPELGNAKGITIVSGVKAKKAKAVDAEPDVRHDPPTKNGVLAVAVDPTNKRITPGTPTKEWRIRKSQRVGQPGFFVQGGEYRKVGSENQFFVGVEHNVATMDAAKAKLAEVAK
jgi:hypothetical protein